MVTLAGWEALCQHSVVDFLVVLTHSNTWPKIKDLKKKKKCLVSKIYLYIKSLLDWTKQNLSSTSPAAVSQKISVAANLFWVRPWRVTGNWWQQTQGQALVQGGICSRHSLRTSWWHGRSQLACRAGGNGNTSSALSEEGGWGKRDRWVQTASLDVLLTFFA